MPHASDIDSTVKSFIMSEFLPGEDPAQLTSTTPLISTGILDSLATLKLVAFLEQQFSVVIEAHEADSENLETLERISSLVRSKR
jgi:acyl carrier protein